MSEITLTPDQVLQASRILWNYGQYRTTRTRGERTDIAMPYQLTCDDDDVHEYLVEAGMLVQDNDANLDLNPDAFQWLSDESMERLFTIRVQPVFTFTTF